GKDSLRTGNIVYIGNQRESLVHVRKLVERKIAIVKSSKAGIRAARIQVVVGRCADVENVVTARLSRIDLIDGATVSAGVEVPAGTGLDAVAAGLHVPEQGFAELNSGCLVGENSFHAEDRGHRNSGEGSKRAERNDEGLRMACVLGAHVSEESNRDNDCCCAH